MLGMQTQQSKEFPTPSHFVPVFGAPYQRHDAPYNLPDLSWKAAENAEHLYLHGRHLRQTGKNERAGRLLEHGT